METENVETRRVDFRDKPISHVLIEISKIIAMLDYGGMFDCLNPEVKKFLEVLPEALAVIAYEAKQLEDRKPTKE